MRIITILDQNDFWFVLANNNGIAKVLDLFYGDEYPDRDCLTSTLQDALCFATGEKPELMSFDMTELFTLFRQTRNTKTMEITCPRSGARLDANFDTEGEFLKSAVDNKPGIFHLYRISTNGTSI